MKHSILFVGIGGCAGNYINLLSEKDYDCIAINTSYDDLQTVNTKYKYHITGAKGCAKDRQLALSYAKNHYDKIIDYIDSNFPQKSIIIFIFSTGGGTGSGLSPVLLSILTQKYPNKNYGAIVILPNIEESYQSQVNTMESYKQLSQIKSLKNLYILDNNNAIDRFEINNRFVNKFDKLINITKSDIRGIIDKEELEKLLTTRGSVILLDCDASIEFSTDFPSKLENMVFTQHEIGCKYVALSVKNDLDYTLIKQRIGTPIDYFQGYNNESNFIALFGMSLPRKRIQKINELVNSIKSDIIDFNDDIDIEMPLTIKDKNNDVSMFNNSNDNDVLNKEQIDDIFARYS